MRDGFWTLVFFTPWAALAAYGAYRLLGLAMALSPFWWLVGLIDLGFLLCVGLLAGCLWAIAAAFLPKLEPEP